MRSLAKISLLLSLALSGPIGYAQQAPEKHGHEIQLWVGGGHSVPGGTRRTGMLNLGLRYGWVITDAHGPGFLKGRVEYAVDALPMFLVFQPGNSAYGIGLNPLVLKWNFVRHGRVVPYFELSGGSLFTTHEVPPSTSSVNFISSAALGFHHLANKMTWSLDVRYLHLSNAGLASLNPGINTVQVRLGLGSFRP